MIFSRSLLYFVVVGVLEVGWLPTWDTGTQRHESDGRNRVFETDGATHLRWQIANDGRQSTDQQYGHDEGHVTVRHVYIFDIVIPIRWLVDDINDNISQERENIFLFQIIQYECDYDYINKKISIVNPLQALYITTCGLGQVI